MDRRQLVELVLVKQQMALLELAEIAPTIMVVVAVVVIMVVVVLIMVVVLVEVILLLH